MLGGSFWRSGNQLRISAQLIVATTDAHLWERASTTTPAITSRIANAPRRRADRRGSRPADQTSHGIRLYSPGARRKAQAEFARCVRSGDQPARARIDARSAIRRGADPFGRLARRPCDEWTDRPSRGRPHPLRKSWLAKPWPHRLATPLRIWSKGEVLRAQGRYEEAILEYETARALNRNLVVALYDRD